MIDNFIPTDESIDEEIAEQEYLEEGVEDDAILLNTDLNDFPDAEPLEEGEKLLTIIKASTKGIASGDSMLVLQVDMPEDEY
jgi:hypothetical protein